MFWQFDRCPPGRLNLRLIEGTHGGEDLEKLDPVPLSRVRGSAGEAVESVIEVENAGCQGWSLPGGNIVLRRLARIHRGWRLVRGLGVRIKLRN